MNPRYVGLDTLTLCPLALDSIPSTRSSDVLWTGCKALVESHSFDQFIIGLIIVSSICLALDVPRLDPASSLAFALIQLNLAATLIFTAEFVLKVPQRRRAAPLQRATSISAPRLSARRVCGSLAPLSLSV